MSIKRHHRGSHPEAEHVREDNPDTARDDRPEIFQQREHDEQVRRDVSHDRAYDRFGGVNPGAAFFGWLSAIGLTALLAGIIAAIASAVGAQNPAAQTQAEQAAGTVGIVSAVVLPAVLLIGYYAGGYVAGRMSRFDGAKQGLAVWTIGLVVTVLAVAAGWVAGDAYNVLDRVNMPRIPIPQDQLTWGGAIAGLVILFGTLLAAMAGGKVGQRYHDKVDHEAYDWR